MPENVGLMSAELMLMGFISLTITILQQPVSKVCIPSSVYNKWTPCSISKRPLVASTSPASAPAPAEEHRRRLLASETSTSSSVCSEVSTINHVLFLTKHFTLFGQSQGAMSSELAQECKSSCYKVNFLSVT